MKGILLAGGSGSRLYPLTKSISKQLLPIYDKPTIYYPLSVLLLAGIKEILIISTPRDLPLIKNLLGTGEELGLKLEYAEQKEPKGIAEAFIIGERFIGGSPVSLILGDNIFYGNELTQILQSSSQLKEGAKVYAYHVPNPEQFGVVTFSEDRRVTDIQEKPKNPKSNWAVTGLYFYDQTVVQKAKTLKPSARGELEITDLNRLYLHENKLTVETLGRGMAWLDSGTPESLAEASVFVQVIEKRQGLKISCLEEIALFNNFITQKQFVALAEKAPNSDYGNYLKKIASRF